METMKTFELPIYLMNEEALQELEERSTVEIKLPNGTGVAFDQFTLDSIVAVRACREVGV